MWEFAYHTRKNSKIKRLRSDFLDTDQRKDTCEELSILVTSFDCVVTY